MTNKKIMTDDGCRITNKGKSFCRDRGLLSEAKSRFCGVPVLTLMWTVSSPTKGSCWSGDQQPAGERYIPSPFFLNGDYVWRSHRRKGEGQGEVY